MSETRMKLSSKIAKRIYEIHYTPTSERRGTYWEEYGRKAFMLDEHDYFMFLPGDNENEDRMYISGYDHPVTGIHLCPGMISIDLKDWPSIYFDVTSSVGISGDEYLIDNRSEQNE